MDGVGWVEKDSGMEAAVSCVNGKKNYGSDFGLLFVFHILCQSKHVYGTCRKISHKK